MQMKVISRTWGKHVSPEVESTVLGRKVWPSCLIFGMVTKLNHRQFCIRNERHAFSTLLSASYHLVLG